MSRRGFSLVELLIGVVIISILGILSIRTIGESRQRENLLKVANQIVDQLRKAQSDAKLYGQLRGVCFKKNNGDQSHYTALYKPQLASGSTLPSDNDCVDGSEANTGPVVDFSKSVKFCATCDAKVNFSSSIFFDSDGMTTEWTGAHSVYEICIINADLPEGTRAREIEVGVNGDIQLLAQTAQGQYSGVVVNQGNCK